LTDTASKVKASEKFTAYNRITLSVKNSDSFYLSFDTKKYQQTNDSNYL